MTEPLLIQEKQLFPDTGEVQKNEHSVPFFTIIIPCKNEEKYIGSLLKSLENQDYDLSKTPILIADANSTDNTLEIIESYRKKGNLQIKVIPGGTPAVGRNNGAALAQTEYLAFIDADIQLGDPNFFSIVEKGATSRDADLVSTYIKCINGNLFDKFFWACHGIAIHLKPYATGMFTFIRKQAFDSLGGFDERIQIGEDYDLTQRVKRNRFAIANTFVYTTNRRFVKMGYLKTFFSYAKVPFSKNHRFKGVKNFFDIKFE